VEFAAVAVESVAVVVAVESAVAVAVAAAVAAVESAESELALVNILKLY